MHGMKKPNVLFIIADRFRNNHPGVLGEHPVDTPDKEK